MATKTRSVWYCSECGHKQAKWAGQCPQCENWNTLLEELEAPIVRRFESQQLKGSRPVRLTEVGLTEAPRHKTGMTEVDRLFGGGPVVGSLALIGGEPGIGKSTLVLQIAAALCKTGLTVLYICAEESVQQTFSRAKRLGIKTDNLLLLNETHFSQIKSQIDAVSPDVIIVDSIQLIYKEEISSSPGSVSQVRENATEFMHIAKGHGITTFLVGHVTKSGEIAGPRLLEHLVDTVLYFEGDKQANYRMMRVIKNRFGACDEIAVFEMGSRGLIEIPNPSEIFLEERQQQVAGSVIIPTLEGSRPFLIEVQALVTQSGYTNPSRKSAGVDANRLALLLAVLEKKLKYQLRNCDVFVSVAGGMRITEPSVDLGILLAIASSFCNVFVDPDTIVMGEVGLGGEIRGIPRIEARIKEASRMGFKRALLPRRNMKGLRTDIQLIPVELVEEAIDALITG